MVEVIVAKNGKAKEFAGKLSNAVVPLLLLSCEVTFFGRTMHHIVRFLDLANRYSLESPSGRASRADALYGVGLPTP